MVGETTEINKEIEFSLDIFAMRLKINGIFLTYILLSSGLILNNPYVVK